MLISKGAGSFKAKIRIFEHLPCFMDMDMDMAIDMVLQFGYF